jgi:hypothetical protein
MTTKIAQELDHLNVIIANTVPQGIKHIEQSSAGVRANFWQLQVVHLSHRVSINLKSAVSLSS